MVWNVRGLNSRARRNVVRELVAQENISLLSLQETKLDCCSENVFREICGVGFDFLSLPAMNTRGAILLAWRCNIWSVSNPILKQYSLTVKITLLASGESWWISSVYGPQSDQEKILFLDELREVRAGCTGTWLIWGDFNLIYQAADKNNSRLNRSMM